MNWKKWIATIICIGLIGSAVQSCNEAVPHRRRRDVRPTPTPNHEESIDIPDYAYAFVNESIYQNLLSAKSNFEAFFKNGDTATQIRNHGTELSHSNAEYIRKNMKGIYDAICGYITAFDKNDVKACCRYAESLYEDYYYALSREYLYTVLVEPKLPSQYRGGFSSDTYDNNGNIRLQNGNLLFVLGGSDDIIEPTYYSGDYFTDMYFRSEYFRNLPSNIIDQYSVFQNTAWTDGVCYVMNESKVERYISGEWDALRREAQSMYGCNTRDVRVLPNGDGTYRFDDGNKNGLLTGEQNTRVNRIYALQDAMVAEKGNPGTVHDDIKTIAGKYPAFEYIRF